MRQLAARLSVRRDEIQQAVAARVYALGETETSDWSYLEGLHAALEAGVGYCLEVLEHGGGPLPVPEALLAQARTAASHHVPLDLVLRRYLAGYTLVVDFAIDEAEAAELLHGPRLQRLLRAAGTVLDRVVEGVSEEYTREARHCATTREGRHAEVLRRLLVGDAVDTSAVGYDFSGWHLGAVLAGEEAKLAFTRLAAALDSRVLFLREADESYAAWLGGRRPLDTRDVTAQLKRVWTGAVLALGVPASGLNGWRLTHHEARAGWAVAKRTGRSLVWYCEVPLLAATLRDELLAASLRHLYLDRLGDGRHGEALRETLCAYFETRGNLSAAAALLGISRRTVGSRVQRAEALLGGALWRLPGLETALAYEQALLRTP